MKKLISVLCVILLFASLFSTYASSINNKINIKINNNKFVQITISKLNDIINITADEAVEIAELFIVDAMKSDSICWNDNTKVVNVIPMYDNSNKINAYTIELTSGYIVVSAFLDAEHLIPEWSDEGEPLFYELNVSTDDKIIYLGGYEYYVDDGSSSVQGLYTNNVSKNELVNYVGQSRNISNIPESAILNATTNISPNSVILDPIGHANANYGGQFVYTYQNDRWENYMDYFTVDYGKGVGYSNHCGPTAITNIIAAFRNRYPTNAINVPSSNNTLFTEIANLGISNGYFSNSSGTLSSSREQYFEAVFDEYSIDPYSTYSILSHPDDVEEYKFPMTYNAIFYVSVRKHTTYSDHAVVAYGLSIVSNQNGITRNYFHIADGWGVSPRYLELNDMINWAYGIEFM